MEYYYIFAFITGAVAVGIYLLIYSILAKIDSRIDYSKKEIIPYFDEDNNPLFYIKHHHFKPYYEKEVKKRFAVNKILKYPHVYTGKVLITQQHPKQKIDNSHFHVFSYKIYDPREYTSNIIGTQINQHGNANVAIQGNNNMVDINQTEIGNCIGEIQNSSMLNEDKQFMIDIVNSLSVQPKSVLKKALDIAKEFALNVTVKIITNVLTGK